MRLRFLGTGASGGTPGRGRSRRSESSVLVTTGETVVLVDATRDLEEQLSDADRIGALVLTHAHRDASGGIPALRRLRGRGAPPVLTFAAPATFAVLEERYARLDHLEQVPVRPGEEHDVGPLHLTAVEVPHARSERFPTYAWRIVGDRSSVVYASDVAEPTDELASHAAGAELLVVDGAMYERSIFSHLRIDRDLPTICGWEVGRILLTQIGSTAPPHERLEEVTTELCDRAAPAFDGLEVEVGDEVAGRWHGADRARR